MWEGSDALPQELRAALFHSKSDCGVEGFVIASGRGAEGWEAAFLRRL